MSLTCQECGKIIKSLPFKCIHCGANFCSEHKLPELHNCPCMPKSWHK